MDQLHEELKEPVVAAAAALAEARDSDSSDTDEKREGDRSPSEDEFLSCDSSSDRGEGDGQVRGGGGSQAEAELLTPDEAGRAISEKERMKDRKFSWGQQRTSSEQVDEDADVDTAMAALDDQPAEARPPSPRSPSPCRTPGARQPLGAPGPLCPAPPVCRAPTRTGPLASSTPWGPTTRASGQGSATWQVRTAQPAPRLGWRLERGQAFCGFGGGRGGHGPEEAWLAPASVPRRCWRVLFLSRPRSRRGCLGPARPPLCPQSRTTRPTCAAPPAPAAPCATTRATPSWPAALLGRAP